MSNHSRDAHRITIIGEERAHGRQAPFIRIRGDWLADLGYNLGDVVTVEVDAANRLIITKAQPEPDTRPLVRFLVTVSAHGNAYSRRVAVEAHDESEARKLAARDESISRFALYHPDNPLSYKVRPALSEESAAARRRFMDLTNDD